LGDRSGRTAVGELLENAVDNYRFGLVYATFAAHCFAGSIESPHHVITNACLCLGGYPLHLHRHSFELTRIGGKPTSGVIKDVVMLAGFQELEFDFVADNPGRTLFHCHQQLHMDFLYGAVRLRLSVPPPDNLMPSANTPSTFGDHPAVPGSLKREVGVLGATMMGLGSMVGAGVFLSIGIAAGIAGPAVIPAIVLAALVATCNALSSAQLAASMPVSGGTYEYGYAYLTPWLGFTAGWMFLCAKTASAATAALGFAGYLLRTLNIAGGVVLIAILAVAVLTLIVLLGIRRSNRANLVIVSITLFALLVFVVGGLLAVSARGSQPWLPFFRPSPDSGAVWPGVLEATALMFVAFTGYARIATLGEEMRDPTRTIPRAIIYTLIVSAILYIAVGTVGIATIGPEALAMAARADVAPLVVAARTFNIPGASWIVAIGAMTAMLGVLLNLILGLSRVVLAMGRRGDMPGWFAEVGSSGSPAPAIIVVGIAIGALALTGNAEVTWSFSAFTVLIYYAITNLAALRLPSDRRLYSPLFAWGGLAACLGLAFFVEREIWLIGLGLIAAGLLWHGLARYWARR
jgi:basic amino acid/polyamine antiporter, APA family